jgi:hypothetical protein
MEYAGGSFLFIRKSACNFFAPFCIVGFGRQKACLAAPLGRWHKRILCAFYCTKHSDEPPNAKSCSALASTILESPLHRTKATYTIFFCAICQAALPDRPFDARILIEKFAIMLWRQGACRCRDPPQAENPASRILFYATITIGRKHSL